MSSRCVDAGYEVAVETKAEGFAAGAPCSEVPTDLRCLDWVVREKIDFVPLTSVNV